MESQQPLIARRTTVRSSRAWISPGIYYASVAMDGDVDLLREALRVLVDRRIMDARHSFRPDRRSGTANAARSGSPSRNRRTATAPGTVARVVHQPQLNINGVLQVLPHRLPTVSRQLLVPACWNRGGAASKPCWPSSSKPHVEGVSTRRVDDLMQVALQLRSASPAARCRASARHTGRSGGEFPGSAPGPRGCPSPPTCGWTA